MKKILLTSAFLLLSICFFSIMTFAQTDPGGSGTGTGGTGTDSTVDQGGGSVILPYTFTSFTFKRNNGNGFGVCGGDSQIRVVFSPMPTSANQIPVLTAIWYNGINLIPSSVWVNGSSIVAQTMPYVSYCLTGTLPAPGDSQGNIPPAAKFTLGFNHQ